MRHAWSGGRGGVCVLLGGAILGIGCTIANGAVTLLGVQYRPDQLFPEHDCFWRESQYPASCSPSAPGAHVHVFLRNTGGSAVTITDAMFAGFSLKEILVLHYQVAKRQPASIWLDNLTPSQLQTLLNAGEPVWWKADPATIPPGGTAQVAVRLRSVPVIPSISMEVITSAGNVSATIPVEAAAPQVAGVGFSSDLTKVHLYWRRGGGDAPTAVLMDGTDVTANTTTVSDPALGIAVSVFQPVQPLGASSYHVFQGVYADGKKASAGVRAWVNKFLYGTWGGPDAIDEPSARASLIDLTNHGLNSLVMNGSAVTGILQWSPSGRQFVANQGYGFVIDDPGKWAADKPFMWFIRDEPDWADSRLDNIPTDKKIGGLAQMCLQRGEELRAADPTVPTTVNINAYSKPYCWYNYGLVPDVFMTDPYYQARMREAYWYYPTRIPLYQKATYIYAVAQLAQSSCEPNPLHMVLYSCQWRDDSGAVFPFPTPQSKRIEVYYALAGGAKGLSYWWWPAGRPSNGLADGGPDALALYKEMGLLGNEIKTAVPLLVASHPVSLTTQATTGVWVRSLAVGSDTIILLAVNDQYLNDEQGTHYTPVTNASVNLTLPAWMASASAFEISASGTSDLTAQLTGNQLQIDLGTLDLTRMIVVTGNEQLRTTIQQRYEDQVQAGVCAFAPEICTQEIPPSITEQPKPRTTCAGTTATFGVGAWGPGTLAYQWQKNQVNLVNGGRFSGVTTNSLTITSAADGDTGNYRCVVSNAHGSVTSDEASLTIIGCNPGCMSNLGFESGFTDGIGNGWTKFVRIGNVTCSEETTEVHGGVRSQEIFSPGKNNDGGVYQQFLATPGQPYTVKAWIKVRSGQTSGNAEGFFGIDPTGGTDPNSAQILWASKPWEYWSQDTWSVTAQNTVITVYLRGRATRLNQTAYIWVDDVELAPGAPTDLAPLVFSSTSIRWRWTDLAIETGYRVQDSSGADKSGLLAPNTAQWTEPGLTPNTPYTRHVQAINDCGESEPSAGQTARTLSAPPEADSVTPSAGSVCTGGDIEWTAVGGFGPGTVQYYRYAWDQNATYEWAGTEPQWSSGTLTTSATGPGTWYLHVQGYNASHVPNGTYDYDVNAGQGAVAADLDCDEDVDGADFDLFDPCFSGPAVNADPGCENRDFDLDQDVDMSDFGFFQRCYSGEDNPADPNCAD